MTHLENATWKHSSCTYTGKSSDADLGETGATFKDTHGVKGISRLKKGDPLQAAVCEQVPDINILDAYNLPGR